MNKAELDRMKSMITALTDDLRSNILYLEEEAKPDEPSCALGCQARMESMGDKSVSGILLETARQRLIKLENALKRIESGTYGLCIRCGKEIPPGRLEAVPEALVCVSCADKSG